MTIQFTPAKRSAVKARIALAGPSGSGKTFTALTLACALADKVAVIDTERGSASMYVGLNGWKFDTLNPQSFSPASLIEALGVAAGAGYGCVVIDSLSHYWMGVDGMLEQVDARTEKNNSFGTGWKAMRPVERRMIDALVSYPGHVVVTLRTKTEYVIEKDDRGKAKPVKIGLKPEQRDGLEYEFSVVGDMDHTNTLTVSKTRLPMLTGAVIPKPGPELAATIRDWLADGDDTPGPLLYRAEALSPDASYDGLRALYATVERAGLLNAPVTDEHDSPTVLGDLIVARGNALKAAAAAPPKVQKPAEPAPPEKAAEPAPTAAEHPAGRDTVPAARTALAARGKALGASLQQLGAAYQAATGTDLADEDSPRKIREFIADLDADPKAMLGLAGAA